MIPDTDICPLCGGPAILVDELHSMRMGERPVTFMDRFYRCSRCGEEYFNGEMMDDSLRRATAKIREEDGLLTPDDILALRGKYGLSQAQLERLIGAGAKTVVRWERGTVAQNKTADTLLRVLGDHPDVVARLARERKVKLRRRALGEPPRLPARRGRSAASRRSTADAAD